MIGLLPRSSIRVSANWDPSGERETPLIDDLRAQSSMGRGAATASPAIKLYVNKIPN